MKMKHLFYIFFLMLNLVGFAQGQNAFELANEAYADANYEKAIRTYQGILEEGLVSSELYFNLGNAYFKNQDLAKAIYHYEKALQINPGDPDVVENLNIAKTQTVDEIEEVPRSKIDRFFESITSWFSLHTWAWVSIVFSLVFGLLLVFYFRAILSKSKRLFFGFSLFCFVLALASFSFASFQLSEAQSENYAIIFQDQVEVRVEPNQRSEVDFELNKGTKVELGSSFRDFQQVILPDGTKGWLQNNTIKKL
ncbi:MAG: tetratricopeptide repeat protein [Psychroflexus sp.]